ncbi:alpha/beta fold hydrolase [Cupriavidus necator]
MGRQRYYCTGFRIRSTATPKSLRCWQRWVAASSSPISAATDPRASWTRRLLARGSRGHRRRCVNALDIRRAALAGYDWGGRSACIAAALWPQRCAGLVSVNSYLIQNIARASQPIAARSNQGCGTSTTSRPNAAAPG